MTQLSSSKFNDFHVCTLENKNIFIHIKIEDKSFYDELSEYFLDESRILRYIENKMDLSFSPSKKNYAVLYKHLKYYIDDFNFEKIMQDFTPEVLEILDDESYLKKDDDGNVIVRLDKIGRFGEYILCNLLSEYFEFECIIPKVNLTTDYNMSIYGIDTLFYSQAYDMIYFGESKVSRSLKNGIKLINLSLQNYEKQIKDEFLLILSNRLLRTTFGNFWEQYGDAIELSINIEKFISEAHVTRIGIPLFIAHGEDTNPAEIMSQLNSIKQPIILGLETCYIIISLPIVNKVELFNVLTKKLIEKVKFYESQS